MLHLNPPWLASCNGNFEANHQDDLAPAAWHGERHQPGLHCHVVTSKLLAVMTLQLTGPVHRWCSSIDGLLVGISNQCVIVGLVGWPITEATATRFNCR